MNKKIENQELIDTIKRPIRHYRITLWGYGGEIVYGNSTKEEYDYWETNIEERRKQFNIPEDESPFNRYMMDKDDVGGYEAVPTNIQREGEWYDQDDMDHASGVSCDSATINIVEVNDEEYNAEEICEIVQCSLDEFIEDTDANLIIGDSDAINRSFMFYAISVEKGTFFDGRLTVTGKIDFSKLRFECTEYPNGDTIVNHVFYGDEEIDNDGGDTNGKSLYIELVD